MLRFHLDEHVAYAVAHGLRQRQIDVTTTVDAGLLSAPDEDHLEFALRENRVIFTSDSDFLRLVAEEDIMPASSIHQRNQAALET